MFYQLIADIKSPKEAKTLLADLLSPNELTALAKRLAIAYWVTKGRGFSNIKGNLKVSSATIAQVQEKAKDSPGFRLALEKIQAEEWARYWAGRIKRFLK